MEVHHPHAYPGFKKKWTEHLFEFFMLFLAVFSGFIAENIRETYVERHRVREYVELLKRDLKADTASINFLSAGNGDLLNSFDSLVSKINSYPKEKDVKSLYTWFRECHVYYIFKHTGRAINQLENSGQYRLLKDLNLADTVSSYYENAKAVEDQSAVYMDYFKLFHETAFKVFEYSQFQTPRGIDVRATRKSFSLITDDPALLKELASKTSLIAIILQDYVENMRYIENIAATTLKYLEKNYPSS